MIYFSKNTENNNAVTNREKIFPSDASKALSAGNVKARTERPRISVVRKILDCLQNIDN